MAITTIDGAIAGLQFPRIISKASPGTPQVERMQTYWAANGSPAAGAFDATLNGVALSSTSAQVTGQIPFTDPASGNCYLARLEAAMSAGQGTLILCDRLWHNGGYDVTVLTAQNSTTPTWPARDAAGSTNGDGVQLLLENETGIGGAPSNVSVSYTNSAGTSGRTGTNIVSFSNGLNTGTCCPIGLQAGDTGVRSVQSLTFGSSGTTGTVHLVAYREIARLEIPRSLTAFSIDALTAGFPQMYAGSVPFLIFQPGLANTSTIQGGVTFSHG
jgi:hypothetical protein